jgi:ATP-dependent Clp protease ATP-binding subunit ClpB
MLTALNIPLSPEVETAISAAQAKAREHHQAWFTPSHLLWALLREEGGLFPFIEQVGKNVHNLRSWAELRIENTPKSPRPVEAPVAGDQVQAVLQEAYRLRTQRVEKDVTALTLLEAICTPEIGFTADQLKRFPLTLGEIQSGREQRAALMEALGEALGGRGPARGDSGEATPSAGGRHALEKYCDDLTARARQGKIDPVIGREKELKQLVEILGKRLSPNVLIVGESGVGKTAIVGGLALNILSGKAPSRLKDASIFELDVNGRLVAGAYKGEVESRLKDTIQAVKSMGNAILFIDEMHTLLDPNGSVGSGAANLLKPEMAKGDLTLIGATTEAEYREFFENDSAFKRRFTLLRIEEPSEELAVEMLRGLAPRYESFHKVNLDPEALPLAVQMAKRYLGEKKLPVSALEIIDVTMSAVTVLNDTNLDEVTRIEEEWKAIPEGDDKAVKKLDAAIANRLSHLLVQRLNADGEAGLGDKIGKLREWTAEPKTIVTPDDIAATVAYLTGIPMGKIQAEEQKQLLDMEKLLRRRVVGQDHALKTVAEALRRSRAGLRETNKPAAAFFFLGPTGTGKTELAKTIAEQLFNDPNAMLRFDMSEFKEEHSAALLYGSPPGYVGYKEGGLLVNKIRQRPYSVVLFDEIEKAHKSVYDVFLQILDEGTVHDKQGKTGDFTKAIVIFTSNIGSEWIAGQFNKGHIPTRDELRLEMADVRMPDGTKAFRPELLGRGMHLVPFAPISEEVASAILEIQMKNFSRLLKTQNILFEWTEAARKELVRTGFSPQYGARPLKDTIEERIATPMSDKIIAGEIEKGHTISVDWDTQKNEFIWVKGEDTKLKI